MGRPSAYSPLLHFCPSKTMMCRILVVHLLFFIIEVSSNPKLRCVNGVWQADRCFCKEDYVGNRCHRKMHCSTFLRNPNGTCVTCDKYWEGPNCDKIICHSEFGTSTADLLMCQCTPPATGVHCEELLTENIYLYYNQKMEKWGPVGALTLIPMIACLLLCNRMAKKRHVERVEKALGDTRNIEVDSKLVEHLLEAKG